jgi:hypothetical protein
LCKHVSLCRDAIHHAVTPRLAHHRIAAPAAAGRDAAEGRRRAGGDARGDEHYDVGLLTLASSGDARVLRAQGKRTSFTFLIEAISSRTGRRRLEQARREAHPSADGAYARLSCRHADNLGRWDRLAPASPTNRKYESLAAELGSCWQNKNTDKMGTFGD